MSRFDSRNPYPLYMPGALSYAEDQEHAADVDRWLGLEAEKIETELRKTRAQPGQQLWIGLPVQAMLTPYTELRAILDRLAPKPGQTVVDLGAGYGRMGFVMARHYPEVRFVGYEYVPERVAEGRRCLDLAGAASPRVELWQADLSHPDFAPIRSEFYFIYDYGTREAIQKTLIDLRSIASRHRIAVVGRGRSSRDAIERDHPWLSQVVEPEHLGHYSIYRNGR